jgi:uncharacterized protein YecE (DUF72 family)
LAEKARLTQLERRIKREARREKERAANPGRAEKMRAARVAYGLRTRSTSTSESTPQKRPASSRFQIGCSGWFYWHWRELLYPAGTPTHKWFDHYAARFRTVELNAPFYSWPTVATVQSWRRNAGRRKFVYTVKVCELITHIKRFSGTKELIRDFGYIADLLGPKMGCFLFQLPPSFHYTPARLKRIVMQLDRRRRDVVEFRHRSWWNEDVYSSFRAAGVIFCSCSGPRLPDELVKTADEVYIRFHGTKQWYRHNYSEAELAIWAERIRLCGASQVWAYFNNDRNGYSIKNAQALIRQLKKDGQ